MEYEGLRAASLRRETNLVALRPSRKRPRDGDVFALSPRPGVFLFGRVVSTGAMAGSALTGLNLIYIYDIQRSSPNPPQDSDLVPSRLLVPPIMTNRLPWSRGYFETVDHRDVHSSPLLTVHCFRDLRGRYFDERGNELTAPIEPVGERGVHSFRTIDDLVSDALGIPRAPD